MEELQVFHLTYGYPISRTNLIYLSQHFGQFFDSRYSVMRYWSRHSIIAIIEFIYICTNRDNYKYLEPRFCLILDEVNLYWYIFESNSIDLGWLNSRPT